MLNPDQEKTLKQIISWWKGSERFFIIDGRGGVGKSYLVNYILQSLTNCSPILLAPTNEALKQLREKTSGNYLFKTIHSSLGIAPTKHERELLFEQVKLPSLWDNINLAIVDESSMLDAWILEILLNIGVNVLFLGHEAQLPPVRKERLINDPCISPVFQKGFRTNTLTIPMRNTGALWDFNNLLEENIYSGNRIIPATFDIKTKELKDYIFFSGKEKIFAGETKMILWSNAGVDSYNMIFRESFYGKEKAKEKYLPGDKIILTAPFTAISNLETHNEFGLKKISSKNDLEIFYSNSKAEVLSSIKVIVKLNNNLAISCYKIHVISEGKKTWFYEPENSEDYEKISSHYEHLAWREKNQEKKRKAFMLKHFILSCFARIKHYYAATAHRLQGASIPNAIVINSDISRNPCIVEANKCRYVACSRVSSELMFYRGDL